METEKKTFLRHGNQISNEWKTKKKTFVKSAMNEDEKKNFSASWQSNQNERMETEKTEKTEFVRKFSQMSNKMRLRMLEMSPL